MSQKKTKPTSPTARWINTRVEYQWDSELQQYVEISTEGYWYDGPMALAHNQAATNQVAYRLYQSDNSTAVAAQNTSGTIMADSPYVCRILWENTGDVAEDTQTYQLQYQNVTQSTGWQNVTGSSTHVRTADASGLTNGTSVTAATLTGQSAGTFANGEEIEDGLSASVGLASGRYTEYWFAFQLLSADINQNDTIELRIVGSSIGTLDSYSNTPSMTGSEPTPLFVTMQNQPALAVSAGSLTVQANIDTNVSLLTPPALSVSAGSLSITQTSATEVTFQDQPALAVTPGTLNVQLLRTVEITGEALAISAGSLTVQADVDTNVTLAGQALTISAGTLGVVQQGATEVTLAPQALTLTGGTLGVSVLLAVDLTADALTVTPGSLSVQANIDTTVSPVADSLALTPGTLSVSTSVNTEVNLVADALAVSAGALGVQADVDTSVSLSGDVLALTPGTLTVETPQVTRIDLVADALVLTPDQLSVQANVDTNITLQADALAIIEARLAIQRLIDLSATAIEGVPTLGGSSLKTHSPRQGYYGNTRINFWNNLK